MEPRVFPKGLGKMPGSWADFAACVEAPPGTMFPDAGAGVEEAKRWCQGCPVESECLMWALEHNEIHGVWGGQSERARRRLRRRMILSGEIPDVASEREDWVDAV